MYLCPTLKYLISFLLLLFFVRPVIGQEKKAAPAVHSPKKAAIYSAVLPGLGQVYNHQAWKVGVIYAGMGTLGYFVYDNNRVYKDFLNNWLAVTDPASGKQLDPRFSGYSANALHNGFSAFRKYRDQCAIGCVILYAANIIDANVFAHLYKFNVDDISFLFTPVVPMYSRSLQPGFTLKYTF